MLRKLPIFLLLLCGAALAQSPCNPALQPQITPNYQLSLPAIQGCNWGQQINSNFSVLDGLLFTTLVNSFANDPSPCTGEIWYNTTSGQYKYCPGGVATVLNAGGGGSGNLPSGAQVGDIIRWNVLGDGNWDAVNGAVLQRSVIVYPGNSGTMDFNGYIIGGGNYLGGLTNVQPTNTVGWGMNFAAAATGSTNTVVGYVYGQGGSGTEYPVLAWHRYTTQLSLGNTTSVRYWLGLGVWSNGSGLGVNGTQITGTTAYANDSPNKTTLGFRYSAGTDTHWQAVSIKAGSVSASTTVVDTGITPDTSVHVFEMATNSAATSVFYFIDHVLVATISTNLPVSGLSASDSLVALFAVGDNKNTATAMTLNWYGTVVSFR